MRKNILTEFSTLFSLVIIIILTFNFLADSFREDMASMIDGETDDIDFDWDQAQKELLNGAGIDMAKEMECKLLTVAEEVNDLHCF